MYTRPYGARLYCHDRGDFKAVRNANILIYWPHGFGDWVQLGYILPSLNPTNRYWITRFGDDVTSIMEGHPQVTPLYVGGNAALSADGDAYGNRHFGLNYDAADGSLRQLALPLALYEECQRHKIDAVLWSSFPEPAGYADFPFHSKARNVLRYLVREEEQNCLELESPLRNSINFQVPSCIVRWVESRLKNCAGFGERRLCIIARNGYTSVQKNWGHLWREDLPPSARVEGEECRDFMRTMLRKDPRWMFLIMEDRLFVGEHTMRSQELHSFSYAELFGTVDAFSFPFGLVMKVLVNLAELCVGVPAGPYHLSMAKPDLPTVGIWIDHFPSWFDEPKRASVHVISRNVRERGLDRRPGSFTQRNGLCFRTISVETRVITGEQVVSAVEILI